MPLRERPTPHPAWEAYTPEQEAYGKRLADIITREISSWNNDRHIPRNGHSIIKVFAEFVNRHREQHGRPPINPYDMGQKYDLEAREESAMSADQYYNADDYGDSVAESIGTILHHDTPYVYFRTHMSDAGNTFQLYDSIDSAREGLHHAPTQHEQVQLKKNMERLCTSFIQHFLERERLIPDGIM